jgi:IclR family acetate operon transcriptional repressor
VKRVTTILTTLGRSPQQLRLTDISRAIGADTGTTYRILSALVRDGFVYKDEGSRRYALGYELFQLGASAWPITAERAHRYLALIAAETATTVFVASRHGREIFLHKKIAGPNDHRLPADVRPSQYLDAHATAVGKVLLAFAPIHHVKALYHAEPLRRHTSKTIPSLASLMNELARVRRTGFATENSEFATGVSGIAVPIFNPVGQVNLAAWLLTPSENFARINRKTVAAKVQSHLVDFISFATRQPSLLPAVGRDLLADVRRDRLPV